MNSPAESIYTFSKEVQLFAVGREQTTSIVSVKRAIVTIPPTSVEAERVFSAAGLFFYKAEDQPQSSVFDK